jgi:hypothetical protein
MFPKRANSRGKFLPTYKFCVFPLSEVLEGKKILLLLGDFAAQPNSLHHHLFIYDNGDNSDDSRNYYKN